VKGLLIGFGSVYNMSYIYIYIISYSINIMTVFYNQRKIFLEHKTNSVIKRRVSSRSIE